MVTCEHYTRGVIFFSFWTDDVHKKFGNTVLYIPMEGLQCSAVEASKDRKLIQRMESKLAELFVCICMQLTRVAFGCHVWSVWVKRVTNVCSLTLYWRQHWNCTMSFLSQALQWFYFIQGPSYKICTCSCFWLLLSISIIYVIYPWHFYNHA